MARNINQILQFASLAASDAAMPMPAFQLTVE
jgi:hypothetical protein